MPQRMTWKNLDVSSKSFKTLNHKMMMHRTKRLRLIKGFKAYARHQGYKTSATIPKNFPCRWWTVSQPDLWKRLSPHRGRKNRSNWSRNFPSCSNHLYSSKASTRCSSDLSRECYKLQTVYRKTSSKLSFWTFFGAINAWTKQALWLNSARMPHRPKKLTYQSKFYEVAL